MTEQTPEPVTSDDEYEIDESLVEPQKTTNDLSEQDDVEISDNQSTAPDTGVYEDPDGDQ